MIQDRENDHKLLDGIKAGHKQSIEKIYQDVLPSVIIWVKKNSGTEMQARDVFQDAMIALFKRLQKGKLELTTSLHGYLVIVCKNLWFKYLRDNKKTSFVENKNLDNEGLDDGILIQIENNDRRKLFLKHFDLLGKDCQKILSLFFDKISFKEIASKLKTTEGYIKKKKFQCKEKLSTSIKGDVLFSELYAD